MSKFYVFVLITIISGFDNFFLLKKMCELLEHTEAARQSGYKK